MKGVAWGILYNQFKDRRIDHIKLEEEIDAAIKRADIALYEAKTTGRNKVVLAQWIAVYLI